jgi:predicted DsbA family dithiol-disulfide isomerase
MPAPIRIDFVSDVSCPWCAIGLNALEQAIRTTGADVEIHFQPFELNPQMAPEGEDATEHLVRKYGLTPEQLERNREMIRARGTPLGFAFGQRRRIHNTFDAHRLLHWAGIEGAELQRALKHALLRAYHSDGEDVGAHEVLARIAGSVGLDAQRARAILDSGEFSDEVRAQERYYIERGIQAVPAVIFNQSRLVSGGQPVELFEQVLRQLAGARPS